MTGHTSISQGSLKQYAKEARAKLKQLEVNRKAVAEEVCAEIVEDLEHDPDDRYMITII